MVVDTGRVFGDARATTAVAVSRAAFPNGARAVHLAPDHPEPVPTAGSVAAGPVLLVPRRRPVPQAVAAEVARLDPSEIVAVGGRGVLSERTLAEVAAGRPTRRLAGADPVAVAVAVALAAFPEGADEVVIVPADVPFQAALAAAGGAPVLLAPRAGSPALLTDAVTRLGPSQVLVVGGPEAVSEELVDTVAGGRTVVRLASGRWTAAVAMSRHRFPDGAPSVYVVAASAVSDTVVAGVLGGPLLAVPTCDDLPGVVRAEIDRLSPDRIVAVGGPAAVCTDVLIEAARMRSDCGAPSVRDLGPASVAAAVVGAAVVDGRLIVATRGRRPMVVGALDLATDTVVASTELPTGDGAWGVDAAGGQVLVGTYEPADVYRLDPSTLRSRRLASLSGATHVFCLATTPDGSVVVGTSPDGAVYAVDPARGTVRSYGAAVDGQYLVRSIAATVDTIYAGVGSRAHLVAIDRSSGARRALLPPELAGESFVYALALSDRWLAIGTEPSGRVAAAPVDGLDEWRVPPATGERTVDAIAVDGDTVWFTGRTTGSLYRWEIGGAAPTVAGVPFAREETRMLAVRDDVVLGVGGSGVLWRYRPGDGTVTTTDLRAAGLPDGPEEVQSVAAIGSTPVVGGHWGVQVHLMGAGARRVRVPGEPKAMLPVDDVLYLALYPGAELWTWDPDTDAVEPVATIGHGQARPRRMALHRGSGRVLVVSQADYGQRGGALSVYDPASGSIAVHRDIVAGHGLSAVAVDGDTVYLGSELRSGGGLPPARAPARLAAWDLAEQRTRWQIAPFPGTQAVIDLVAAHGLVYGYTAEGVVFALNPLTGQIVATARVGGRERSLVLQRGVPYAAHGGGLIALDPDTLTPTTVMPRPVATAAPGPGCGLFVVSRTDLLRVDL